MQTPPPFLGNHCTDTRFKNEGEENAQRFLSRLFLCSLVLTVLPSCNQSVTIVVPPAHSDVVAHRAVVMGLKSLNKKDHRFSMPADLNGLVQEYYAIGAYGTPCAEIDNRINRYDPSDTPAIKLAKYFALVNCCDIDETTLLFLCDILSDDLAASLVEGEMILMTAERLNSRGGVLPGEVHLRDLVEQLGAVAADQSFSPDVHDASNVLIQALSSDKLREPDSNQNHYTRVQKRRSNP